ncbi:MAG: hypothetical protein JHC84_10110 [Solirubrobacteraceae bacterium]|nr:hypothetical protein [Solirubrobacteraceae bacterium]
MWDISSSRSARRRARRARRAGPVLLLALAAFAVGVAVGADGGSDQRELADRYAQAWAKQDYAAMHALISPEAQERYPLERFEGLHREAASTATVLRLRAGAATEVEDDVVTVPTAVRTNAFGSLRARFALPVVETDGARRIAWAPYLAFPGLNPGERLRRDTELPERGSLSARDGTLLANGQDRASETQEDLGGLVGELGPIPESRRGELRALGVPGDARVGISGLERAFDERLIGTPGGTLRAESRVLARTEPQAASGVRTSIDLDIQQAAREAMAGRYGGVAVLQPGSGEVLALTGIALDGLQPPGSTFKIITLAAALEAGAVSRKDSFPVETSTTLEGVTLENANGETCGGTLKNSFAHSCNTVFAPLGAKAGDAALVKAAEEFGFNTDPGIPGAATSTIPAAGEIGDDLAVGSTAIGQGKVQATALMMAWVAATVADGGERPRLTLELGAAPEPTRVMKEEVATTIGEYMRAVVTDGTGVAAAIDGVSIAGKTGTAELRQTQGDCQPSTDPNAPPETCTTGQNDPSDTTAWFSAFAPLNRPRVAVGVVLPGNGTGGDTAAPVARQVVVSALKEGPQQTSAPGS